MSEDEWSEWLHFSANDEIKYSLKNKLGEENKPKLRSFIDEVVMSDPEWAKERREAYLVSKLINLATDINELYSLQFKCEGQVYQWFGDVILEDQIKPLERQYKKIRQQLHMWKYRVDEITAPKSSYTDEEIEMAKAVEISNFVEMVKDIGGKGWARCPFGHTDKTPSFCWYRKNNSYYSFCCGKGGDVISLVMELEKLDFTKAIEYLLRY